jgi:predicted dithiol-disulfide oxidoreductase (DUF899 family)
MTAVIHHHPFPGETEEYRRSRDELLRAEQDLRERTEAVAQQRRKLPLGGRLPTDYAFTEWDADDGVARPVALSELFEDGKDTLFLYSFMFIPDAAGEPLGAPCPSCTSIIDAISGQARHVRLKLNLAVVAKVPIERFRAHAYARGWHGIRLLSSEGTTYNRDYRAEADDGSQFPMGTVFMRRGEDIHHFWSTELRVAPRAPGQDGRHVDFMWPLWNILDTTPAGRGDWRPTLSD